MKKLPKCPKCGKSLSYGDHLDLNEAQLKIARYIDHNKNKFNDKTFIHNLRGEIVHTSHHVWISNKGDSEESGHEIRQKTRRILWDYSKRKFRADKSKINLDKYRVPHEVNGIIRNIVNKFKP